MPAIEIALWRGKPVNEDMSKQELIQIIEHLGKEIREMRERNQAVFRALRNPRE